MQKFMRMRAVQQPATCPRKGGGSVRSAHSHETDLSNGNIKQRFASSSVGAQSHRSRRALRSLHAAMVANPIEDCVASLLVVLHTWVLPYLNLLYV